MQKVTNTLYAVHLQVPVKVHIPEIIQGIKKAPPFIIGTKTVHINAYTNYNYINSLYGASSLHRK